MVEQNHNVESFRRADSTLLGTNKAGLKFSVANEKGTLFLSAAGQPPVELHPVSDTKFFISILNTEVTFDRTDKGEARALNLLQEGTQISAERKR